MPIDQILPILIAERDKLSRAIEALQGPAERAVRAARKPPAIETTVATPAAPKKRHMSAAARRKIAAAQKKRWAALRAAK